MAIALRLNDLPDDQGREQAIGLGVIEIKTLFGDFTTVDQIKAAVQKQIEVEHAKFQIIEAVADAASCRRDEGRARPRRNPERPPTGSHRGMVHRATDEDVQARVAQLKTEEYTLVLKEIASTRG